MITLRPRDLPALVAGARAPGQRVNALVAGSGAASASVEAAARYLAGAVAVTGQVLRIG